MQKVHPHILYKNKNAWTAIKHLISRSFQNSIRITFHLSFTVLFHYRLIKSFLTFKDGPLIFKQINIYFTQNPNKKIKYKTITYLVNFSKLFFNLKLLGLF